MILWNGLGCTHSLVTFFVGSPCWVYNNAHFIHLTMINSIVNFRDMLGDFLWVGRILQKLALFDPISRVVFTSAGALGTKLIGVLNKIDCVTCKKMQKSNLRVGNCYL